VKDAAARVVADLAQHMLENGYIHFDEKPCDPVTMRIRATIGVVPVDKVLPVKGADGAARGQGHLHVRGLRQSSFF
jgi:hypothetical protein